MYDAKQSTLLILLLPHHGPKVTHQDDTRLYITCYECCVLCMYICMYSGVLVTYCKTHPADEVYVTKVQMALTALQQIEHIPIFHFKALLGPGWIQVHQGPGQLKSFLGFQCSAKDLIHSF